MKKWMPNAFAHISGCMPKSRRVRLDHNLGAIRSWVSGGSSKDLDRIVERESRVSDWFQKGCGVPVLKPGEKFEPGLLECDQDILPDWPWLVRHNAFRIRFLVADWALLYIQKQKWKVVPKQDRSGLIAFPPSVGLHPDTERILGIRLNSNLRIFCPQAAQQPAESTARNSAWVDFAVPFY